MKSGFVYSFLLGISLLFAACGGATTADAQGDSSVSDGDVSVGTDAEVVAQPDTALPDVPPLPGLGIDYGAHPTGIAPRYDVAGEGWTATPWPTDRLRDPDGGLDLNSFPTNGIEFLEGYVNYGVEVLDGWGPNTSIYFEFEGALNPAALPAPKDTIDNAKALIQLVNVTPESAKYGEQLPLLTRFHEGGSDAYYRPNTLVLRAVLGYPMAEGETYCAILTRGVKDGDGNYLQQAEGYATALEEDPSLSPLKAWLESSGLIPEDVATATCFTTSKPTQGLRSVQAFLEAQPLATLTDIKYLGKASTFFEFRGHYLAPNFQAGEKPYAEEGGDIRFDEAGQPIIQQMEEVRFLLMVPTGYDMPDTGWPVVQYAHGTGGNYETCKWSVGANLTMEGFAVICIDQPLHGERGPFKLGKCSKWNVPPESGPQSLCQPCEDDAGCTETTCTELANQGAFCLNSCTNPGDCPLEFSCREVDGAEDKRCVPWGAHLTDFDLTLYSFNFLNPRSGRFGFQQSAIDTMSLARMIAGGNLDVTADGTMHGQEIRFDGNNIQMFGHSHGGISGALVLGVDPKVSAGMLSGAGGGLIQTVLLRKDPMDISDLVTTLLEVSDADFDIFHPSLAIIQMLVDATDPINYAYYWLNPAPGGTSKHVFMTEGTADHATPAVTTEALAAAGGLPLIHPVAQESLAHLLKGWDVQKEPVFLNATDSAGESRTTGLRQWFEADHWVALDDPIAIKLWRTWFRSIRKGHEPSISQK